MTDLRSAHLLTLRALAAMVLAYGDRTLPLDRDARSALDNALADLRMMQAWDNAAKAESEAA